MQSSEVTKFIDDLNPPLRAEVEKLRMIILASDKELLENIKWNGPNYHMNNQDRISMRIQPAQIQLIFHRGAKKLAQPSTKIIDDKSGLLLWKENDRAIASFKNMGDIERLKPTLEDIVRAWIKATI